ncbi:hypothetical protein IFM89_035752 [Coptis chinensis]|uniref:Uncharacterized protein n=1 Tax=Coptis chinensis TaxID=261450 RepID=A0A835HAL7_9MAGN|nr:hypothetical protein IFM89_035752 [Coptis chinensis]
MGGGEFENSSTKETVVKSSGSQSTGCFSCGLLDHWADSCPLKDSSCFSCSTSRVVRTSRKPHSWGQKLLSCPNCNSFQWVKDVVKMLMLMEPRNLVNDGIKSGIEPRNLVNDGVKSAIEPRKLQFEDGGSSSVVRKGKAKVRLEVEVDNLCEGFEAKVTVKGVVSSDKNQM